jgi:hypothetical protein
VGIEKNGRDSRFKMAIQAGSYVRDNYSEEPKLLRLFQHLQGGVIINKKKNIWIDAGIFNSYIGFESVNAFDNLTVTRSILAENSPYYLSGIKLNYPLNKKTEIAFYALSGWQKIVPDKGSLLSSGGLQITSMLNEKNQFNYSLYLGRENRLLNRPIRYFNNLYWHRENKKWKTTLGLDFGFQQNKYNKKAFDYWFSPVFILSYKYNNKWKSAIRFENYNDPSNVMISTIDGSKFSCFGFSFNLDHNITPSLICRIETRCLNSNDPKFYIKDGVTSVTNYFTFSMAYQFLKTFKQ